MTSGFDQLERELRRAETRQARRRRSVIGTGSARRVLSATVIAGSTFVVVAIAVGALVLLHSAKRNVGPATSPGVVGHYTNPAGWSISYPATLRLTRSKPAGGLQRLAQITLTSFVASRPLRGSPPPGSRLNLASMPFYLPLDAGGKFPADGVALILQPSLAGVLGPDSRFPITIGSFGAPKIDVFFSRAKYEKAAIPRSRSRAVVAYGEELTATVLIGRNASPALRRELANTIASLSFPRLHPGTHVGLGVLLGPAANYPVGSFTLVHARFGTSRSEPFYLAHGPGRPGYGHQCLFAAPCVPAGAFYGIGPQYNTRRDQAPPCDLRFDRQDEQFYCTNLGVRWDRVGRVISRPADESYIGSIEGLYAKVAWDRQVMMSPGFGPQISRAAVHQLWPSWHQPNEPLSR